MPHAKPAALALSASILVSISGCLVPAHSSVVHSIVILGQSRDAVHRLPCISTCSSPQPQPPPLNLLTIYLPHGRTQHIPLLVYHICLRPLGSSRYCARLLASCPSIASWAQPSGLRFVPLAPDLFISNGSCRCIPPPRPLARPN